MKSSRRTSLRLSQENSRRRSAFLSGTTRRLLAEQLEPRMLLAGDVMHNIIDRCDTNGDEWVTPADALHVINQLNRGDATAASAEGEQQSRYMNDVNNDGFVSPIDALMVINRLNNPEGEGGELVRYTVQALDASGTNLLSGSIQKGTDFYLQVLVRDLRMGTTAPDKPDGVAAAFLDVLYNKSLANVEIEEIQTITFLDSPSGGTFRLTFNSATTGNITFDSSNAQTTAANMQTALQGLANIGAGNVEVKPVNLADPTAYTIRFQGNLGDQDVSMLTANTASLTPGTQTVSIVETSKGVYSAAAFKAAFRFGTGFVDARNAEDGQVTPTVDANRINDAGAGQLVQTIPNPTANKELFRVRMNTLNAGTLSLLGNVTDVEFPAYNTLLLNKIPDPVVTPDLITVVNRSGTAGAAEIVTITEPFSANPDTFNFAETASPSAQSLNVRANDTPQPLTGISVTRINGGTAPVNLSIGTVTLTSGAISFTPLANVNGSASFTYTLSNGTVTDTATVTINVSAVNNAPVNTVPGAQTTPEDTAKVINGISIADIDVSETANAQMQVDLTVQNGKIALQNTSGILFLNGTNNSAAISIAGSLADLNTAINGLLYTPNLNFNGADTFRIITSDLANTGSGGAKSDNDTVTITVTAVNDAPTITLPSPAPVLEEDTLVITGTTVDDVDALNGVEKVTLSVFGGNGGRLNLTTTTGITFVDGTTNDSSSLAFTGTLTNLKNALASFQYKPQRGDAPSQSIAISINDQGNTGTGGALSANDSFNVDVTPLSLPFARKDTETVNEDSTGNLIAVLANDLVHPNNNPILQSVGTPVRGTTALGTGADTGKVVYTPTANFWGTDTFTYTMFEDNPPVDAVPSMNTVTVTITNLPDAPVAVDSSASTDEDTATDITLSVSDADDFNNAGPLGAPILSTLTPTVLTGPANGTATVLANGKIRYTPALNYFGPDSFTYRVSDGGLNSNTATVTITVGPINDGPVAQNGTLSATEDTPTTGTLVATDVDSPNLTYSLVSTANAHGTVIITDAATGAYSYSPDLNYNGSASFTFKANDGFLDSNTATVTITIAAVNDAPVAQNGSLSATEDILATGTLVATDVDSPNLTYSLVSTVDAHGTVTITNASTGAYTYKTDLNYNGPASFTFKANDGFLDSNTATVTINITPVNDAPVSVPRSYDAFEDTTLTVNQALGLQTGGSDVDNATNTLQVIVVTQPNRGGSLSVNQATGAFTYTPALNWNGTETFTYKLNDGQLDSNTSTVTFNIQETNDNPTARDDGTPTRLTMIKNFNDQEVNVLANDDASPDFVVNPLPGFNNVVENLTITAVFSSNGSGLTELGNTVRISADGKKVLFDDTQNIEANDQFSYTISDGRGGTATATAFLEVVNFIPTEITGKVFVDNNNDGIQQANEKPLAGVKITLRGHDNIFNIDFGTDTDGNPNNDVAALVVYTDINGNYRFDAPGLQRPGMRPGTYTITQEQPAFMRDGIDTAGNTATVIANDQIRMVLPLLGVPGGIHGNNFAERGLDPGSISINEILASSSGNGLILAANGTNQLWTSQLAGWTNLKSCSIVLSPNTSTATLTFTDMQNNVSIRTISQVGNPRFRLMGRATDGSELIRIEGTAADFGLNLMAANSQGQQAEGEADGYDSYTQGVDELMGEVGNA